MKIFTPIVEHLGLQIRFNLKSGNVEIRTCKDTKDVSTLTKAADFVKAFVLGFQVEVSDLMRREMHCVDISVDGSFSKLLVLLL